MSGDLGVGSSTPTTVSHAQTTGNPTDTRAGHIGMFYTVHIQLNCIALYGASIVVINISLCHRVFPIDGPR